MKSVWEVVLQICHAFVKKQVQNINFKIKKFKDYWKGHWDGNTQYTKTN